MYVGKKPMNVMETPVRPFIQKDQPRFQSAGKHWMANTGDIIREQADNTQLLDGSILAVSRQENQYRYGKNSYIPKVNKNFRPPLIDPEYDLVPLSRIPRPRTQVRINPDASRLAQTQNIHGTDVSSFIDDRVMKGNVRPSYTINMPKPIQDCVPEVELKLKQPQVAGYSGMSIPTNVVEMVSCDYELENNIPNVYANSSMNTPVQISSLSPLQNLELDFNQPNVEAMAGMNTPYEHFTPIEYGELEYNNPQASAHAGINTNVSFMKESNVTPLNYKQPQTSMRTNPQRKLENGPTEIRNSIKTQDPIKLNYTLTKNTSMTQNNLNQTPFMRPKLEYNRSCEATKNIPMTFQHQNVKLKKRN